MRPATLELLNEARAAKRHACLVRNLDSHAEALVVDGEVMLGSVSPALLAEVDKDVALLPR